MAGRIFCSGDRLAVAGFLFAIVAVLGNAVSPAAANDGILVERNEIAGTTTITVAARDGRLDWGDVLRGLARAGGLDDSMIESGEGEPLDLTRTGSRLAVLAAGAAVPDVSLRIVDHPGTNEPALRIRIERDDARDKLRSVKSLIRSRFANDVETHGLRFDDGWEQRPADRPLVVLIHGYAARPRSLSGLHAELVEREWPCAMFRYANDGPLEDSAKLLARELARFQEDHPERKVTIVAHSMGGLVARAVVENPELDPGNVARLVMVCTPNQGSRWAELPCGLDCWEQLAARDGEAPAGMLHASIADGLNEARSDLKPGSKFLRDLNARERNAKVRYSLILGTGAPFTAEGVERWRERFASSLAESSAGRLVQPRVDGFFEGLDEPVQGKGDGAVSVERGRLEGVEDTLLLPITHWSINRDIKGETGRALRDAILERLDAP
ncbi:MAG: alpha/beta hydrolase [Planctomycetales bacterium]